MEVNTHRARKRFGQNFLVDSSIIHQIIHTINPQPEDNLVEIGPGQGALTTPLHTACPSLQVIEIDRDLIEILKQQFANSLQIYQGDALKFDFNTLANPGKPLRVVGNLPYNISTPLLFHLLSFKHLIQDMHFMLQKEVVDRLAAKPGQKSFGRLSIMVQYFCQVQPVFNVPPHAFKPAPKVESAIVRLKPHVTIPYPNCEYVELSKLVNSCFQQRRKTLRNCLKPLYADKLGKLDIDLSLRPEQLSVAQFAQLANQLNNHE